MNACVVSVLCLLGALAVLVEGVTVQVWPHPWNPKRRDGLLLGPLSPASHAYFPFKLGGGKHAGRQQEIPSGKDSNRTPAVWLLQCPTVTRQAGPGRRGWWHVTEQKHELH